MKKIDALLKRVELFERLAVYGDRKSFLQALSQGLPNLVVPNDPNAPPGQGGVHRVDPNSPAPSPQPNPPAPLPRIVAPNAGPPGSGGHWVDPNAVSDEAPQVDRDMFIPLTHRLDAPATPEKAAPAAVAKAPVFNPKVKQVQTFLNSQIRAGVDGIVPVKEDGFWGNDTATSLKEWAAATGFKGNLNNAFTAALSKAGPAKA